jgi:hypothetical protein
MTKLTMDSPDERETKLVLVSINWRDGGTSWRLAPATKVGRFYQIDPIALEDMHRDFLASRYSTTGRPRHPTIELYTSLHNRPLSTYREYRASSTISDIGPIPVK